MLRLLGLSKKEEKVLVELQKSSSTPLLLARATKVSRTAVYAILLNLKKRGLVQSRITNGKKHWSLAPEREIEETLYDAKRALLAIPEGRQESFGLSDSSVVVHRGEEAVKAVFSDLLTQEKRERFYALAGEGASTSWNRIFSIQETNRFNRALKNNNIIAEMILEDGWLEREAARFGEGWATEFEGRTSRANVIDTEYFAHGAQIFIFKQSMYLMALGEELVIEIRNSEIQKMILSFFKFMQDNSRLVDANELLRSIIADIQKKGSEKQ